MSSIEWLSSTIANLEFSIASHPYYQACSRDVVQVRTEGKYVVLSW